MSIKIGIDGSASFNALKDLIVGTSTTAKKDINFVKDWNGTIIWQRKAPDIPLSPTNTTITISPTSYSETGSQKPWSYTKRPTVTGVSVNSVALDSSKYTVSYSDNSSGSITGTGSVTAYVRITAKEGSGYSGYVDKNYTISYTYKEDTIDITGKCTITLDAESKTLTNDDQNYTAQESEMQIGVNSVFYNGTTPLVLTTDYTVAYTYTDGMKFSHTSEGRIGNTVTVTIKGTGKYSGEQSTTYEVYHYYVASTRLMCAYSTDNANSLLLVPGTASIKATKTFSNGTSIGMTWNGSRNLIASTKRIVTTKNGNSIGSEVDPTVIYSSGDYGIQTVGSIGGKFVCFNSMSTTYGSTAYVSPDGTTWSRVSISDTGYTSNIIDAQATASGAGTLMTVGTIGNSLAFSIGYITTTDGSSFAMKTENKTPQTSSKRDLECAGLCYAGGKFIMGTSENGGLAHLRTFTGSGFGDAVRITSYKDGDTSKAIFDFQVNGQSDLKHRRIASNGSNMIVCAGSYGQYPGIAYSTDAGSTWQPGIQFGTSGLHASSAISVTYIGGAFYLVLKAYDSSATYNFLLKKSSNGSTWTDVSEFSSAGFTPQCIDC